MKRLFLELFTWWQGNTIGTRVWTWRFGEKVGQDEFGNIYYRNRKGRIDKRLGVERRWVIYAGVADSSTVPPAWHGWLHHIVDTPPIEENYQAKEWELAHKPNMTGTADAYRPDGSIVKTGVRKPVSGDYEAWSP